MRAGATMNLGPKSTAILRFLRDKESLSLNEVHRKMKPMLTRLANAGYIEIRHFASAKPQFGPSHSSRYVVTDKGLAVLEEYVNPTATQTQWWGRQ